MAFVLPSSPFSSECPGLSGIADSSKMPEEPATLIFIAPLVHVPAVIRKGLTCTNLRQTFVPFCFISIYGVGRYQVREAVCLGCQPDRISSAKGRCSSHLGPC